MNSSTTTLWTGIFQIAGCLVSFYYYYALKEIPVVNANNVEPDQMPYSAASDLGQHCLPIVFERSLD